MIFIKIIIKALAIVVFCLTTSYVFCLGKSKTGIKLDYAFTVLSIILALVMI